MCKFSGDFPSQQQHLTAATETEAAIAAVSKQTSEMIFMNCKPFQTSFSAFDCVNSPTTTMNVDDGREQKSWRLCIACKCSIPNQKYIVDTDKRQNQSNIQLSACQTAAKAQKSIHEHIRTFNIPKIKQNLSEFFANIKNP